MTVGGMANKKRKVSLDDFLMCHGYFFRAIREPGFMNQEGEGALRNQVIEQFSEIPTHEVNENSIHALQLWIDRFIDAKTWGRCYRALNQKKYLSKSNLMTLQINKDTYQSLKSFATENKLNYSQAIAELLMVANEPIISNHSSMEAVKQDVVIKNFSGTSNVVALFKPDRPLFSEDVDEDDIEDEEFDILDHWFMDGRVSQQPRKPEGYDFKKNDSYKNYRKRINSLTLKEAHPEITTLIENVFSSSPTLTEDNARGMGAYLIKLKNLLIERQYLSTIFQPDNFVISKGILLPEYQMTGYADDLMYFISLIFGCQCSEITSGNREPSVFTGNKYHVMVTYQVFHHLNDFLIAKTESFLNKCHKNTKKKNRYLKAGDHGDYLMYEILHDVFDEDEIYRLYSNEEETLLSTYAYNHVSRYYDENMPIGGWG